MSVINARETPLSMIEVTTEKVPIVAAEAWEALRAVKDPEGRPRVRVRVGDTACIQTDEGLKAFKKPHGVLARSEAVFYKEMKTERKMVRPPQWLVADMLATPVPDLPEEKPVPPR